MSEDQRAISALRAVAHPVRIRMLSLLTAQAMSAAEVARTLDLTHANASYHLRLLHDAGELVVESEQEIRGGVAKRYRYVPGGNSERPPSPRSSADRVAYVRATTEETVRRLAQHRLTTGQMFDIEAWVEPSVWEEAVDLLMRASALLHEQATTERAGLLHVSATGFAFEMGADA